MIMDDSDNYHHYHHIIDAIISDGIFPAKYKHFFLFPVKGKLSIEKKKIEILFDCWAYNCPRQL